MDKRDHDAILNAYNVAKEQLARKKNDSDSAADALQESMVGVIKARARVKNLTGYTLRAAYREFKRLIDLERLSEQTADKGVESHPDVGWEDRINDRVLIRQLLSKLDTRDRTLLKLYSEDYPWRFIGPIVGLTPQSAKQTCYLLLRQLRETAKGGKLKG
jgi:DNA-directed RNA polymerase specialized sigma24 family protein